MGITEDQRLLDFKSWVPMMKKAPDPVDLLMVNTTRSEHSSDFSSEMTREESFRSMVPYDESETTLEEKYVMQRLPTAFARTLSSIPSFEQTKKTSQRADCHLKIVVVGDGGVGKTCLLKAYVQRQFSADEVPNVFENYTTKIEGPKNKLIELALWDTAGQQEFNRFRPLSYSNVDIVMVCYAVDDRKSLSNVKETWIPEVKHFCPDAPIMLLGLKSDLYPKCKNLKMNANKKASNSEDFVRPEIAEIISKNFGTFVHIQCSSKTCINVDEVFNIALNAGLYDVLYGPKEIPPILKNPFKKNLSNKKSTSDLKLHTKKKDENTKQKCTIF